MTEIEGLYKLHDEITKIIQMKVNISPKLIIINDSDYLIKIK